MLFKLTELIVKAAEIRPTLIIGMHPHATNPEPGLGGPDLPSHLNCLQAPPQGS